MKQCLNALDPLPILGRKVEPVKFDIQALMTRIEHRTFEAIKHEPVVSVRTSAPTGESIKAKGIVVATIPLGAHDGTGYLDIDLSEPEISIGAVIDAFSNAMDRMKARGTGDKEAIKQLADCLLKNFGTEWIVSIPREKFAAAIAALEAL